MRAISTIGYQAKPMERRVSQERRAAVCLVAILLLGLVAGCGSTGPAPVGDRGTADVPRSGVHEVQRGDTLYSIAWRYGRDWRELAVRNGIAAPYVIRPGDRIDLAAGPARPTASRQDAATPAAAASSAPARSPTAASPAARPSASAVPAADLSWGWPVEGEVIRGFVASGARANKGLDIRAREGAAVAASAAGEVVYAGSGLRGFGQLVIVKHDDTWLSAYAHNSPSLVREGQRVSRGDRLAVLEGSGDHQRLVHFEIRRHGSPVDPVSILPRR